MPAHLPAVTTPGWPSSAYNLSTNASGTAITAWTETGILAGTTTFLQASAHSAAPAATAASANLADAAPDPAQVMVPAMDVQDVPFREWRGLQLDLHGTGYHSIPLLKTFIRMARWYKLNTLTFNLGPSVWLSPVMKSTTLMNQTWKEKAGSTACYGGRCDFYSAEDMADLIEYGRAHGVRLVPSTGLMPGVSEMVHILNTSMLPADVGYTHHDWMDEIDGLGPSTYTGSQTGVGADRFWKFIGVAVQRVYNLFAAGWPGGKLPTWHVGAVEGEGGMDGTMLRHFYDAVQAAAVSVHGAGTVPVSVGMYNGINANDPAIADVTANLVTHWYTGNFSQSSLKDYIKAGWQVCDITWVPLYLARPIFSLEQTFELFNVFREGSAVWEGGDNTEQYWVPGRESQTLGAIMSTWTARQPDELGYVRMRAAPYAEHAWNYRPYPYPQTGLGSWGEFAPRGVAMDKALDRVIGPIIKNYRCDENTLTCVPMPTFVNGSAWSNGTHYQSDCGGPCCGRPCPGPPRRTAYGGRLWPSNGYNTSMATGPGSHGNGSGIAAADAHCVSEAITMGLVAKGAPAKELSRYKALLADEAGCGGNPCRRASVTPGHGDGAIDWVIAPDAAYYLLDNTTYVTRSNATRMLGVANHTKVGGGNQISPFGPGWTTLKNRTCDSWRWSLRMQGGPYGVSLGSQGWEHEPFTATAGIDTGLPCSNGGWICVEMASLGPFPPPPPPNPPPSPPSPPS